MNKTSGKIGSAGFDEILTQLLFPDFKEQWHWLEDRPDSEGVPAARFLSYSKEKELTSRDQRRIAHHLAKLRLVSGKTLEIFDFKAVPNHQKSRIMALSVAEF